MAEFKTPIIKKCRSRVEDNPELQTPIKIPASPFLQQIGYGCGVTVFSLERSPKVGFIRSPWAIKKRNSKIVKDKKYNERIQFEAEILRKLNHPNIIGFRAFSKLPNGEPCLAMEKLDASLGDRIEQKLDIDDDPFPANDILKIMYEIAKGLEYLHHVAYILHGDIKSYNVLISSDYKIVKLCDFGVSLPLTETLEVDTSNGNFNYVGTECWSAPEIIFEDGPVTNKADIWACGLVVWEMIALSAPHIESSEMDDSYLDDSMLEMKMNITNEYDTNMDDSNSFLNKIVNTKYGTRPSLPAINLGKEYEKVLEVFFACTTSDYKVRPSAKGLVNYFENYVFNSKNKKIRR
ncbi:lymphokine-activated killer T-cell-originated protein kinase isoform X1 [Apis mellifera]|uniref:Lymphokine-activated killer T-cell-originated protein kinase isoform X1 n=1 Tax=Apis mellifera TaxID=7460 RepID=A0A7M7R7N2_APIME|nr:lymphokine-activated killer T-cell-originated protein kinase isoform X1 [Apis mellifera]|eukprot:XP_623765.3 lymphokine-activated killer T-cell-originated protein kinase isoform X1 [Apis mellifera]